MSLALYINGEVIEAPSHQQLREAVLSLNPRRKESTLVLAKGDYNYIQICAYEKDKNTAEFWFDVDCQWDISDYHHRSKRMLLIEEVINLLILYSNEDSFWKDKNEWEIAYGLDVPVFLVVRNNWWQQLNKRSGMAVMFFILIGFLLGVLFPSLYLCFADVDSKSRMIMLSWFKVMSVAFVISLISFYIEGRVFSTPQKLDFKVLRFCKVFIFLVLCYLVILQFHTMLRDIILNKISLGFFIFICFWERKICLQRGFIYMKGYYIRKDRNPNGFKFGIFLHSFFAAVGIVMLLIQR